MSWECFISCRGTRPWRKHYWRTRLSELNNYTNCGQRHWFIGMGALYAMTGGIVWWNNFQWICSWFAMCTMFSWIQSIPPEKKKTSIMFVVRWKKSSIKLVPKMWYKFAPTIRLTWNSWLTIYKAATPKFISKVAPPIFWIFSSIIKAERLGLKNHDENQVDD